MRGLLGAKIRSRVGHGITGVFGVFLDVLESWWFTFFNAMDAMIRKVFQANSVSLFLRVSFIF